MGIYDREYYRSEGPSFLGSFAERGKVCKWLIGINIVCFVLQLITLPRPAQVDYIQDDEEVAVADRSWSFTDLFDLNVDKVKHGQVWRLLTYGFLHAPETRGLPMHILFNMLFLWWFGSDVEDMYGPREFLAVYLTAVFLGGVAFVLAFLTHMQQAGNCLGASGGVLAIMVLCAIHFPTRIIYLFFFLPVPIWLFVLFEVAQDAFGFLSGHAGRTAVSVHLAGAAFAFCYYKAHWRLMPLVNRVQTSYKQLFRPKLRVYREDPPERVPVTTAAAGDVDEQLEAKLDAVLEKVARYGQSSLTEPERQILLRASEIYKRKRT